MKLLKGTRLPNGFFFLPLHYTHDVEGGKNTYEWYQKMRESFPRPSDFDKEMEIDFGLHIGTPAYAKFSDAKHIGPTEYDDRKPLRVAMDFNANPMSLVVSQIDRQRKKGWTLSELVYAGTIDDIISDFRAHYPSHRAEIFMYGDATRGTNAQTAKGNWDIVKLAFRGYHVQPHYEKIPLANPAIGDRLNAANLILSGNGEVEWIFDEKLVELPRDFREVILTPDGKKILKINDPENPYYFRTHPSDAWSYMIYAEFPTVAAVMQEHAKKREPMRHGRLLGEVDMGRKAELERDKQLKRKPLDRSRSR